MKVIHGFQNGPNNTALLHEKIIDLRLTLRESVGVKS